MATLGGYLNKKVL
ncbi:hypothetical protein FLAG1_12222, partial [Fusarium langsethiae]